MSQETTNLKSSSNNQTLLLGTGLAFASLILLPAAATHLGLGSSLTGALRIALMKASYNAGNKKKKDDGSGSVAPPCCH